MRGSKTDDLFSLRWFFKLILGTMFCLTLIIGCGDEGKSRDENRYGVFDRPQPFASPTFSIFYDGSPAQSTVMTIDCFDMGISTMTAQLSSDYGASEEKHYLGCVQNGKIDLYYPYTLYHNYLRIDGRDSSGVILYSSYITWHNMINSDLGTIILTYIGPDMAKNITDDSATLSSRFTNPSDFTTTIWFEYGANNAYDSTTTHEAFAAAGQYIITEDITGLTSQTSYQYRLVMQSSSGTTYGPVIAFTTLAIPEAVGSGSDSELAALIRTGSSTTRAYNAPYAYYLEDGFIKKALIDGGTVTTLTSPLDNPSFLAVDSNAIYFCETTACGDLYSPIKKIGLNGGAITVLTSSFTRSKNFALNSSYIYFQSDSELSRVGTDGGTVTSLATIGDTPIILAVDSENVYFFQDASLKKVSLSGGAVITLATGLKTCQLLVDSDYVYFVDCEPDTSAGSDFTGAGLKKISKNGGVVTTLSSTGGSWHIDGLDATYVYFDRDGTLYRIPK